MPKDNFCPRRIAFIGGTTDIELLRQIHAALVHELDTAWAGSRPGSAAAQSYELLIMASIVQKESGLPQELPKIAGLYLHRLSIGMRLQADPTVIYGLGQRYDGNIHTVDLQTDGPYNTYTRAGCRTPIALAGAAAIRATARPEKNRTPSILSPRPRATAATYSQRRLEQHKRRCMRMSLTSAKRRRTPRDERLPGGVVTFEGIEGVGKTTQVARLSSALELARHSTCGDAGARRYAFGPRASAKVVLTAAARRHCRRPRSCC